MEDNAIQELPGSTFLLVNPTSFRRKEVVAIDSQIQTILVDSSEFDLERPSFGGNAEALRIDPIARTTKQDDLFQPTKKSRLSISDVVPQQIVGGDVETKGGSENSRAGRRLILAEVDAFSLAEVVEPVMNFTPVILKRVEENSTAGDDFCDEIKCRGGFVLQNGLVS